MLNNFLLALLQTRRSHQSTHPFHKHEQHRTFPVFRSGCNDFYDRNIPNCRLLGWMNYQLSLFSDYLRHCWYLVELDQLTFHQNYTHYSLKSWSAFFDQTYLRSKRKLATTMFINYHFLKTLVSRNKPYKEKEQDNLCEWDAY